MESLSDDRAEILILVDETGIPRDDKKIIIEGFRDKIGMSMDEKYGTMAFSGDLSVLSKISDELVAFMNEFQLEGRIFPAIRKNTIDQQFKDDLLKYAVFERYWDVDDEKSVILTYDISHKGGRKTTRYYTLKSVGALQIFPSCYWIPERRIGIVLSKFRQIVGDSERDPSFDKSGNPIPYHFRVFQCYAIGSIDGLKRWKDMQLKLFMEKINSLTARTRGRNSYLNYVESAWNAFSDEEKLIELKKVKCYRYWKGEASKELKPFLSAHYQRMKDMGIDNHTLQETIKYESYDQSGNKTIIEDSISFTLHSGIELLKKTLELLHQDIYAFVISLNEKESTQRENPEAEIRTVRSDQFRV